MAELLNERDVTKLEKLEVLKEEIKALEEHLKPRIEATFKRYGAGVRVIGAREVKLGKIDRNNTSWKGLAESNLPASVIEQEKPRHTTPSTSYNAKIVGRASLGTRDGSRKRA